MLYDRRHTLKSASTGRPGDADASWPRFFLFVALSSLAADAQGFVGEYLILSEPYQRIGNGLVAALGVILSACICLVVSAVFFGEITKRKPDAPDASVRRSGSCHHGRRDALDGNRLGVHHAPHCGRRSSRIDQVEPSGRMKLRAVRPRSNLRDCFQMPAQIAGKPGTAR